MSHRIKCLAKGCPGIARIETDGAGGTVTRCDCCERRAEWREKNMPTQVKTRCQMCGGEFVVAARGAGRIKWCAACRPIALQFARDEWRRKNGKTSKAVASG